MYCKNCGKELPDESLFCGYCGAQLEETGSPAAGFVQEQAAKIKEKTGNISVSKYDFLPLLSILKDPFEETPLSLYGSLAALFITIIGCWISFGFRYGLLAALILWASTLMLFYLAERREFDIQRGVSETAQVLCVPSVLTALSGVFALFGLNAFVIMLRLFLLAAAIMVYVYSIDRYTSNMNRWLKSLYLAAIFAIIAACALSSLSWAVMSQVQPY